jgi:Rad3-related DNA helicase
MSVLASRDNYCVNPQVKSAPSIVRDTQCRTHVKSKTCAPYINKDELLKARELSENLRVWDVEEMVELSASYMNGCPYFVAKELAKTAEIVFCPYNYLIDLSITGSIQHILKDSVVIIDEAHNVESICREEASMKITTKTLSSHLDNLDRVFRTAKKFERHRLAQIAAKAREAKKLEENASSLNPQPEYASQAPQAKQSENAPTEPVLPQLARLSSFSPFSISRHSSSSSNQSTSSNDLLRSSQVPGAPSRSSSATISTTTAPPMTQETFVIDSDDDDLEGDLLSDAFVDDEMLESGPPPEFFQMIDFLTPVKQVLEHLLVWMKKVGDKQLTPVPDSHEEKFSRVWNDSSLFEMLEFCTVTPLNAEHIQLSFQKASGSSETLKPKWQMIPSAVWADVARIVRVFSFALNNDCEYLHDYSFILTRYRDKFFEMQLELHMLCLNPAILFRVLLQTARSVTLVSGTLAPFSSLRAELGIEAVIEARNIIQATTPHIIDPKSSQLMALRLNTFPDGAKMRWEYNTTQNYASQDALGEMLIQILAAIPDGVLLFFSSYSNLDRFVSRWRTNQIWERLTRIKAVTLEPQEGKSEFKQAWMTYSNNVDSGKGALFLGVCRGKISEGMDFQDQYARAVIVVGIPFAAVKEDTIVQKKRWNTDMMGRQISQRAQKIKAEATASEPELRVPSILNYSPAMVHQSLVVSHGPMMEAPLARPDMRHESSYLHGQVWYVLQAFRAINQAVGRCIRHIKDYGAIIFFDERYCEKNNEEHLSGWVRQACLPSSNLQESIQKLRDFYANNRELDPPMRPGFRPSNAPPVSPFISKSSTHSSSRSPSPTRNPQAPPILPPALPQAPQEPATYHRSMHSPSSAAPLIRATSQPARAPVLWDRDPPTPSHSKSDPLELPSAADSSHLVDSNGQSPFSRSKHSPHNGSQNLRR